jgi:hypothetical protein
VRTWRARRVAAWPTGSSMCRTRCARVDRDGRTARRRGRRRSAHRPRASSCQAMERRVERMPRVPVDGSRPSPRLATRARRRRRSGWRRAPLRMRRRATHAHSDSDSASLLSTPARRTLDVRSGETVRTVDVSLALRGGNRHRKCGHMRPRRECVFSECRCFRARRPSRRAHRAVTMRAHFHTPTDAEIIAAVTCGLHTV